MISDEAHAKADQAMASTLLHTLRDAVTTSALYVDAAVERAVHRLTVHDVARVLPYIGGSARHLSKRSLVVLLTTFAVRTPLYGPRELRVREMTGRKPPVAGGSGSVRDGARIRVVDTSEFIALRLPAVFVPRTEAVPFDEMELGVLPGAVASSTLLGSPRPGARAARCAALSPFDADFRTRCCDQQDGVAGASRVLLLDGRYISPGVVGRCVHRVVFGIPFIVSRKLVYAGWQYAFVSAPTRAYVVNASAAHLEAVESAKRCRASLFATQ